MNETFFIKNIHKTLSFFNKWSSPSLFIVIAIFGNNTQVILLIPGY